MLCSQNNSPIQNGSGHERPAILNYTEAKTAFLKFLRERDKAFSAYQVIPKIRKIEFFKKHLNHWGDKLTEKGFYRLLKTNNQAVKDLMPDPRYRTEKQLFILSLLEHAQTY